jgi:hypothetical protein
MAVETSNNVPRIAQGVASIASQAALELDDLYLGRPRGLDAVSLLADDLLNVVVRSGGKGNAVPLLNSSTVVVMKAAIDDSNYGIEHRIDTVQDLVGQVDTLGGTLKSFTVKEPSAIDPEEIRVLRAFCVALSRHEFANDQLMDESRSSHPNRR